MVETLNAAQGSLLVPEPTTQPKGDADAHELWDEDPGEMYATGSLSSLNNSTGH